jgi:hypothetical protein
MSLAQIREDILKGCKKEFKAKHFNDTWEYSNCGEAEWSYADDKTGVRLCPGCQAKLSTLDLVEKEILKEIDKLIIITENRLFTDLNTRKKNVINTLNELKSKLSQAVGK